MMQGRSKPGLAANLLLVLLLAGAQGGALAHVFEHDAGTPLSQACATCFTISQLDSSSIDTHLLADVIACDSRIHSSPQARLESRQSIVARQRGPPQTH
ncbi:MAG: hypothetical protein R3192_06485 [Woeseiaceae bacterium]|nr:hypothetical protein [Woeseiaceae bacterium]